MLRDVTTATNFGTKIAINWHCLNDSDYAIAYEGGLSGQPTECRYCRYPAPNDVAMATTVWLSMGSNFDCEIAGDTVFDYRGRFSESSYPMKT